MRCTLLSFNPQAAKGCCFAGFKLGVFLLVATVGLSAQSVFTGPLDYVVGAQPNSIVVADFNGDGLPDLATANSYPNTVTVALQNSDGTFQLPVSYAVGNSPASLEAADVNNDGKIDLLVVNLADNTVSVLLGNGDGTFQAQKVTVVIGPIANAMCCLAVADFNGDGKPDVAAPVPVPTTQGAYGVAILLGNGDGTFQPSVIYPTAGQAYAIAAADFNNDGKPDIAAGNSILLGNGDGTFQAPINVPASTPLVVADFDQDGNLDIATSGAILYGNGDGTFQVQLLSLLGTPLAAGDLNGDGKPDLIAFQAGATSGIQSLLNEGRSTFTIAQTLETSNSTAALYGLKNGEPLDLLIASGSGGQLYFEGPGIVTVLSGNGDGTFPIFPSYSTYPSSEGDTTVGTMAAADFNGDGKPDLAIGEIVGNGHGAFTYQVGLLLNNGTGFASPTLIPLNNTGSYPVAADVNGDGKMDLLVGGAGGSNGPDSGVAVLLGNGDGTFQPAAYYGSPMAGPLAVGDFNNDGKLDVLGTSSFAADLAVILGNGNGSFGLPLNSPVGVFNSVATAFAVADFNRDGKLDVAVLELQNTYALQILAGNGDGTFSIGAGYGLGSNPVAIALGDLNGDGIPDIVVGGNNISGAAPSYISVFLGNGDGTFQGPTTTEAGNGIGAIVISDFNLDGKQDVVVSNANWGDVSLLLGNGDGTFQTPLQFSGVGTQFTGRGSALAVADFDGNGSPDIAEENFTGIFLLLSAGQNGSGALLSPAAIAFGSENVGSASAAQTATFINTNSSPISITSISVSGSQSGDYQQSHTCGANLGAGASCTISVTFTPQAAGARAAAIQITDNASNSPQVISLSGTGVAAPDFTLSAPSGGSSSTISPGQTAMFNLSLTPSGSFSGTVNLTCSISPAASPAPICSIPSSVSVSGSSTTPVTVTVATTAAASVVGSVLHFSPSITIFAWALFLGASGLLVSGPRRRVRLSAATMVLAFLGMVGCGGSSSTPPSNGSKGTPAGTYTTTINATSGSISHQVTLTVIVQ